MKAHVVLSIIICMALTAMAVTVAAEDSRQAKTVFYVS